MSRQFDGDTAEELAGESVARALEPFRVQALLGGRWDPGRGAALKTYFVHGCLIKFVDVAEIWVKRERGIVEELRDSLLTQPVGWLTKAASPKLINAKITPPIPILVAASLSRPLTTRISQFLKGTQNRPRRHDEATRGAIVRQRGCCRSETLLDR